MFAFFGWEAVSHLAGELRDPARQLPRAIFSALTIVAVLYLGLAAATIGVGAHSDVPLADLMASGLGETGRKVTAVLAVLLTMGTMNTYMAAASQLAGTLVPNSRPLPWIGAIAGVLLAILAADLISVDALMKATSATFVAVYVAAMAAGLKLLDGRDSRCRRHRLRGRRDRLRLLRPVHSRAVVDRAVDSDACRSSIGDHPCKGARHEVHDADQSGSRGA